MALIQASRELTIQTPLGDDVLLLRAFRGQEYLSRLFSLDLELASENESVSFDGIVGQNVTIAVTLADESERYFNGWVSRFVQAQRDNYATVYKATVVPWLWFLGQTTDCRIFQNIAVPDLLKQIFQEYGYSDFAFRLQGDFAPRTYCVQYRESDLNFVSRLMEEEGIFYFFEHQQGKHTLVLGNAPASFKSCQEQPKARYQISAGGWKDDDVITQWVQEWSYRPGAYSLSDYNFETPSTKLLSSVKGKTKWEMYDYPGEYGKRADGDRLARIRLEEQQMSETVAHVKSDCRAFSVGQTFSLSDHFRDDQNQEYIITAIRHEGRHDVAYTSGNALSTDPVYENSFECVPSSTPIRPARRTPVPVVQGCHTAVVVGPGGEEIFTDKYGRVKVQFFWDREGKTNENSSCWVRVSYPTAGKSWGAIQIPRIGQEVIVDFMEGDPDRPIITGRTYNAGQMPPWDLPGKGMVSGFKSNSTKGGGGFNELSFDDTKGNELIQVHGQFDMDTLVEHDERRHIKNDRTKTVDGNETNTINKNRKEKVVINEHIDIGADREETVGANETVDVKANRTHHVFVNDKLTVDALQDIKVGAAQTLWVGAARTKTIIGAENVDIGALQNIHVGANQSVSVDAGQQTTIGSDQSISVGGGQTVSITNDLGETIGGNHSETTSGDRSASITGGDTINVGKSFTLEAKETITLKVGSASLVMNKDGTITVDGKDIATKASGKINSEASGDMTLKGSKILQN